MDEPEAFTPAKILSKPVATPQRGASLMLAFHPRTVLIIGSNKLAATRAFSTLETGSAVTVIAKGGEQESCEELHYRAKLKEVEIIGYDEVAGPSGLYEDRDLLAIQSYLDSHSVSLVCVTDTLLDTATSQRRSRTSASRIYGICRERNIPVNISDMPELCDFIFCATHRFSVPETAEATPLQIGVTTNGQGCRLAGRLRREIVSKLHAESGTAVKKLGQLRRLAKEGSEVEEVAGELNDEMIVSSPNRPVQQRSLRTTETDEEGARRRMKWVSQISEYWSIPRLAQLSSSEMSSILSGELPFDVLGSPQPIPSVASQHSLDITRPSTSEKQGRVFLVGSGPGHPSLLTLAAHAALTREADLVLTDKLVPEGVLELIPKHIELRVARKFPGNAEAAQQEMMDMALKAAREGKTVVRLKQGDPALYGRAGEELLFLRSHNIPTLIIPGISSALAGPLFANIPVTQRGAAESLIVCTGVGRGGRSVSLPGYARARTLVVLMGVARLQSVVQTLLREDRDEGRKGERYPPCLPVAIVERASMPDQRVVCSTLENIVSALESSGEQRPPGLLVIGWAVLSLWGSGDMTVLDGGMNDEHDLLRTERWLDGKQWRVSEGLDPLWSIFQSNVQ